MQLPQVRYTLVPSLQVPASQLIHPSKEPAAIRLWHDQLFAKPPKHGGVVAWYVCV